MLAFHRLVDRPIARPRRRARRRDGRAGARLRLLRRLRHADGRASPCSSSWRCGGLWTERRALDRADCVAAVVAIAARGAGVPAVPRRCSARRASAATLERRGAVLGELERLPRELGVRARLDARATCRRGAKRRFRGSSPACSASPGVVGRARACSEASSCVSTAGWRLLAFWASFGPTAGLYSVLYSTRADVRVAARAGAVRVDGRLRRCRSSRASASRRCCAGCATDAAPASRPRASPSSPPAELDRAAQDAARCRRSSTCTACWRRCRAGR